MARASEPPKVPRKSNGTGGDRANRFNRMVAALLRQFVGPPSYVGAYLPRVELPTNCPGCGIGLSRSETRINAYVCECGHHFRIHADAWIALLIDPESWHEDWADLRPRDVLGWHSPRPYAAVLEEAAAAGLNEAVRVGTGRILGRSVRLAVFDFRFVGGTLSAVGGERITRCIDAAIEERVPFVLVTASGGARMQEGLTALLQMAKVNAAVGRLHNARIPYVSVLTDPTFGGTAASLALLADVNLAEPAAAIGFTGPRVIRQATFSELPDGFQSAEFQLEHGQIDAVVPRTELRRTVAHLVDVFS